MMYSLPQRMFSSSDTSLSLKRKKLALRIKRAVLFAMALLVSLGVSLGSPTVAGASPKYPACVDTYLENWDWPGMLQASTSQAPNSGAGMTDFDKSTMSYFIYKTDTNLSGLRNVFNVIVFKTPLTNKPTFDTVSGVDKIFYSGTAFVNYTLVSEPKAIGGLPSQNWAGSAGGSWNGVNDGIFAIIGSTSTFGTVTLGTGIGCVVAAKGITYSPAFTNLYNKFKAGIDHFSNCGITPSGGDCQWDTITGGVEQCATLDIACHVRNMVDVVDQGITSVFGGIIDGIQRFFIPDGQQINADLTSFGDFWETKLGFLSYPVTFFENIFDSFNDTSNNWCTVSSCNKDFGEVFGTELNIDFLASDGLSDDIWIYGRLAIQGLTVLAIGFMLRGKFMSIMHK